MSNVSSDNLRLYFLTLNKTSQKYYPQSQKDSNLFLIIKNIKQRITKAGKNKNGHMPYEVSVWHSNFQIIHNFIVKLVLFLATI